MNSHKLGKNWNITLTNRSTPEMNEKKVAKIVKSMCVLVGCGLPFLFLRNKTWIMKKYKHVFSFSKK